MKQNERCPPSPSDRDPRADNSLKHGHTRTGRVSKEYRSWAHMINRCHCPTNQDYHRYGGKGIRVCDRWRRSFADFLADVGPAPSPKHSIDRIDSNGNYEPSNCRWATQIEQLRNRSSTILVDGLSLREVCRERGIPHNTVYARLKAGAPLELALSRLGRKEYRRALVAHLQRTGK